ncbi:hypothetical protein FFH90_023535 [Pseudomonas sp. ATCC 43928]|uniref:hypothetical protein n=1 Tax=Pseudomonas sp. ATCC 43928 TaxID=676210 RepID=UPI00110F3591|nr:hypothetical protein [Pseudomonas sp. ATCC 43928]QDV97109.1 hypothetical protein FFH90_023535 [Pseudomonas sp. ATCC 43928]
MADVYNYRCGAIARDFLTLVVNPSLDALDAQVKHWRESDDPVAGFIISDLSELIFKTRMAFCLSIQSLWEQQIRTYLAGCQQELGINPFPVSNRRGANSVQTVYWGDELNTVFERLRDIALPSFTSFDSLDLLMLVGNVCRHGDGNSSVRLWRLRPDLWPDYHNPENKFLLSALTEPAPPVQSMQIPREMLEDFVDKICLFWEDTNYIYEESIERKHPSLEARLVIRRAERAKGIRYGGFTTSVSTAPSE